MIPILYGENETSFTSGGIGYLTDCTSCIVTEERNGVYECEFTYPCTGSLYEQIQERRFIYATHDDSDEGQPFEIYGRSEPIDGVVTYNAHHISYKLSDAVVMPFTASSCYNAIKAIPGHYVRDPGFSFYFTTNKTNIGAYSLAIPTVCRDMLGGAENSLLDVYGGGEYEFDKFDVRLYERRGIDTNIEIRYGKNLIEFAHNIDTSESYNVVVPYWYQEGEEGAPDTLVTLPERYIAYTTDIPFFEVIPLDMTDEFEEAPTEAQLRSAATSFLNSSKAWIPSENFEINFAALWQTSEYKEFAPLQRVKLCDTVLVYFPQYGMQAVREKVVKTVYNTLLDRFDEITLNELPTTFSGILSN